MVAETNEILYLHGLDSTLQDDRRAVLSLYGNIHAPHLDYRNTPNLYELLQEKYRNVTAIIGSSAGGLVAYYLAQSLLKPCLLFNPALTYKEELPLTITTNPHYAAYMQIVIGLQDTVINPWQSLNILQNDLTPHQTLEVHLINTMAHSYPISIFKREVSLFFDKIRTANI